MFTDIYNRTYNYAFGVLTMKNEERGVTASLAALVVLQSVMLTSLYAGVPPHPPATTPLFAIGPFVGAAIATAVAALFVGPCRGSAGKVLTALAVLGALVSFGPQKYVDPQFPMIWPAVLAGQVAAISALAALFRRTEVEKEDG